MTGRCWKRRIAEVSGGAPVVTLSALTGQGVSGLEPWLTPGRTAALLGSSGAGKSTLLNALAGHVLTHHDTPRAVPSPGGALLVDTPGMRELGLLADAVLDESFADVVALVPNCRFGNCTHEDEPSCAVQAALQSGELSAERWRAYLKLQRELAFVVRKDDPATEAANRARWKQIHKAQRSKYKHRRRNQES